MLPVKQIQPSGYSGFALGRTLLRLIAIILLWPIAAKAIDLDGSFDTINGQAANSTPHVTRGTSATLVGWAWDWASNSRDGVEAQILVNGNTQGSVTFGGNQYWSYSLSTASLPIGVASVTVRILEGDVLKDLPSESLIIDPAGWLDSFAGTVLNQLAAGTKPLVHQGQSVTLTGWTISGSAVKVVIDGQEYSASVSGTAWSYTFDTSSLSSGDHTVVVRGNGQSVLPFNYSTGGALDSPLTFCVDIAPPTGWVDYFNGLQLNQQPPNTTFAVTRGASITLTGWATDPASGSSSGVSIKVFVDGAEQATGSFVGGSGWTCALGTSSLALGARNVVVKAINSRGTSTLNFDFNNNVAQTTLPVVIQEGPVIASSPSSQTVSSGATVSFSVSASGYPAPTYQWRKGGSVITAQTNSTLVLTNVSASDSGSYDVVATNSVGSATSNAAALTVIVPPSITTQPVSQTVVLNQSASFSVTASGSGLSYQWRRNGTNISGATAATYTLDPVKTTDNSAQFSVVVTNSAGYVTSSSALLTVTNGGSLQGNAFVIHDVEYRSTDVITETHAEGIVAGPAVNVLSGSDVKYISATSVRLVAGFRAASGATFKAQLSATTTTVNSDPIASTGGSGSPISGPLSDDDGGGFYTVATQNIGHGPASAPASNLPAAWTSLASIDASKTDAVGVTSGQFAVDKNGAATYSVPVWVSSGTAGMEPKLALSYSSQAGSGIAGWGWSLGGLTAITRGPKTRAVDGVLHAVDFTDDDQFYLDGQRLILVSGVHGQPGAEYRTEIESFTRVVCYGRAGNGPARFRAWTKAGLIIEYGYTSDSAFHPDNSAEVLTWAANRTYDTAGNYMAYIYATNVGGDDWEQRIARIDYTGHITGAQPYASVVFDYETRTDKHVAYVAGRRAAGNQRLVAIRSTVGGVTAREYDLHYTERPNTNRSLLTEFEEKGAVDTNGQQKSLPRLKFDFEAATSGWGSVGFAPPVVLAQDGAKPRGTGFVDLDGDGRPDFVRYHRWNSDGGTGERDAWLNTPSGWTRADNWLLPADADDSSKCVLAWDEFADFGTRFIDLDNDGRIDVIHGLRRSGNVLHTVAYLNNGQGWTRATQWDLPTGAYIGSEGDTDGSSRLIDINGDGRVDIVWNYRNQDKGALINTGSGWVRDDRWAPPIAINPDTFFLDLNGDGLPDATVHWYGNNTTVIAVALNGSSGWTTQNTKYVSFSGSDTIDGKRSRLGAIGLYLPPRVLTVKSPYGDHEPIGVELVDLNGDGLTDLIASNLYESQGARGAFLNTGRGWVDAPDFYPPAGVSFRGTASDKPHEATGTAFLDVNGDGIVDIVVSREGDYGNAGVYLGTGHGWTDKLSDSSFNLPSFVSRSDSSKSGGTDFVDLDGDGTVDQVWNLYGSAAGASRNSAHATDRLVKVATGLGVSATIAYKPLTDPTVYRKLTDLSGIDSSEQTKVANIVGPMFVVSSVAHDDGVGGQYTIAYDYIGLRTHLDRGSLGFQTMEVVDSRTHTSSVTTFAQNYPFVGMPIDAFAKHTDQATNVVVTLSDASTVYAQKVITSGSPVSTRMVIVDYSIQLSHDLDGSTVSNTTTTFHASGTAVDSGYDAYGNSLYVSVVDNLGAGYAKTTVNTYCDTDAGYAGIQPPDDFNLSRWYLGRLKQSTVTAAGPDVGSTDSTPGHISIPTAITRTSSFAYDPTTGLLTQETVQPNAGDATLTLTTDYQYDQWGNKTRVAATGLGLAGNNAASGSRVTESNYDSSDLYAGRFPVWTRNTLLHTETYTYDQLLGVPISLVGPNGLSTQWRYDSFGRKIQEDGPDGTGLTDSTLPEASALSRTTINYGWAAASNRPLNAVYFIETHKSGGAPSLEFFDSMGRSVGSYTLSGPNRNTNIGYRVVGRQTRYDSFSRAYRTSLPYFLDDSAGAMTASFVTAYDDLGRPLTVVSSADGVSGSLKGLDAAASEFLSNACYISATYAYAGLTTTATVQRVRGEVPNLSVSVLNDTIRTQTTKNSQGWVVSTVRNLDAASGSDDRAETSFLHDPLGQVCITRVLGASGWVDTTQLEYDLRGRKTRMIDTSMGEWRYAYDSAGELITQTDPKSRTTTLVYDPLGRLVSRTEAGVSSTGQSAPDIVTAWTYDTAVHANVSGQPLVGSSGQTLTWLGKLASVATTADRNRSYGESYTYDAVGRSSTVTRTIVGVAHTTTQRYDDYGRPIVTIYPGPTTQAAYATKTVYDSFGFVLEVRDARNEPGLSLTTNLLNDITPGFIYWQSGDWDLWGLKSSVLGNGLQQQRVYSAATGRVLEVHTGLGWPPGPDVQALAYAYDSLGNISTRLDYTTNRQESFDYDKLDRITTARVLGDTPVTTSYDPLGNFRSKSDNGGAYTYGDSTHPYRVTAAGTHNYSYDELGNVTSDGVSGRQYYYATSGQMQRIVSGGTTAEFWFGAGHERVIQQKSNGTATVYLDALVEFTAPVDGSGNVGAATEIRYYVMTPLGRTAVRVETPGVLKVETRWLHSDTLGSVTAVTNEWGQVERRYTYDAWGKQSGGTPTSTPASTTLNGFTWTATIANPPTRGFTDHEMLGDFGLIHMNGRVYDPVLGRFLSADPFVDDAGDGQSYNRYSYVSNNPLSHTDRSGYHKNSGIWSAIIGVVVAAVAIVAIASGWGAVFSSQFFSALGAALQTGGWAGFSLAVQAGSWGGFASGFSGSLLNGGSIGDAFKAGVVGGITGAVSAGLAFGVGQFFDGLSGEWANGTTANWGARALAHGVTQGGLTEAEGGQFRHGFYAAAFSSAASPAIGKWFPDSNQIAERTVAAAVVGGTASALGGGKFVNGAMTGAFAHLFNAEAMQPKTKVELIQARFKVGYYGLNPDAAKLGEILDVAIDAIDIARSGTDIGKAMKTLIATETVEELAGQHATSDGGPSVGVGFVLGTYASMLDRVGPWKAWTSLEFKVTTSIGSKNQVDYVRFINIPVQGNSGSDLFLNRNEAFTRAQWVLRMRYWASVHALER